MDATRADGKVTRHDGFTAERKRLFLAALRCGETVLAACARVGVSNRTAYNHRRRDPGFARDWTLAARMSGLPLELEAFQRAMGVEEQAYAYGKPSHVRTRRSDALLARLLVAEQPLKYGRRADYREERRRTERRIDTRVAAAVETLGTRLEQRLESRLVNFMNALTSAVATQPRGTAGTDDVTASPEISPKPLSSVNFAPRSAGNVRLRDGGRL